MIKKYTPGFQLYLLSKSYDTETVLNGTKLLLVQFARDDVLHYFTIKTINVSERPKK